jgi:hypothetical protein
MYVKLSWENRALMRISMIVSSDRSEHWLGQVSSAPPRDVPKQHSVVCSFITSAEYRQRFSSVVTPRLPSVSSLV